MRVGYNIAWPVTFIVLGAVGFLLGLWLSALGGFSPMIFIGPLMVILGILQLSRTYFEYHPRTRSITVNALIGPMTRHFSDVSVDGNRFVHTKSNGRTKKVPVSRAMAKRADWDAVLAQLG